MRRPFLNIAIVAAGVGIVAFLLFDVKHIVGSSMEPTLHDGETVIVHRWHYGIRLPGAHEYVLKWRTVSRGDLVLLHHSLTDAGIVKRCAATGGTAYRLEDNVFFIDNRRYRLSPKAARELKNSRRIPEGKLFVIGDNPRVSYDSRNYGIIDFDSIVGKVVYPNSIQE